MGQFNYWEWSDNYICISMYSIVCNFILVENVKAIYTCILYTRKIVAMIFIYNWHKLVQFTRCPKTKSQNNN